MVSVRTQLLSLEKCVCNGGATLIYLCKTWIVNSILNDRLVSCIVSYVKFFYNRTRNDFQITIKISGGGGAIDTFRVLEIFQIFGVNVEKIKRRIVQKVWVMDIRRQEKSCSQ